MAREFCPTSCDFVALQQIDSLSMARKERTLPSPGAGDGLAASLHANSQFFDRLVELVPPKYYHDLDRDRVSTKYMKKADKAAAKQAFRKQAKQVSC